MAGANVKRKPCPRMVKKKLTEEDRLKRRIRKANRRLDYFDYPHVDHELDVKYRCLARLATILGD